MDHIGVIFQEKEGKFTKTCKIITKNNEVTLIDDTSKQIFQQTSTYSFVFKSLNKLVEECPERGIHRIVLFCAEKSLPSNHEIHELCDLFAKKRIPEQLETPIPIAIGVVYDDYVLDFLSLTTTPSDDFELVDTYNISEGLDLISCGFDKFRRKSEGLFVLHIGYEDFFEFIIVPRSDQYLNQPSLLGLPSNQKIVGILRQAAQFTPTLIGKYCHLTNAFQLIADSFSDVSTTWVATFSESMPLKCNAALSKILSILTTDILQFDGDYRSNLFVEMDAFETSKSLSNSDVLNSLSLGPDEQEELEYLQRNVEIYDKDQIESMESDSLLKSKRRSRLLHEEEEEMRRRKRLRQKKKTAEEIAAEQRAKAIEEERRRQAEAEERERQKQEREALKQRLDELKKSRRSRNSSPEKTQGTPKTTPKGTPKSTPRKNNSSFSFSPANIASRREKAAERLAQLRAQHENDYSVEESVDEQEPTKKELTPYQIREKKFTELNILISKAMNAAKPDSNESDENIQELSKKIQLALVDAKKFRQTAPKISEDLAKKLKEKKEQHNENQELIKELRTVYLEQHNENLENKIKQQGKIRGQHVQVKIDPNPEYLMAYDFLHEEIKRVKEEIEFLKRSIKE